MTVVHGCNTDFKLLSGSIQGNMCMPSIWYRLVTQSETRVESTWLFAYCVCLSEWRGSGRQRLTMISTRKVTEITEMRILWIRWNGNFFLQGRIQGRSVPQLSKTPVEIQSKDVTLRLLKPALSYLLDVLDSEDCVHSMCYVRYSMAINQIEAI